MPSPTAPSAEHGKNRPGKIKRLFRQFGRKLTAWRRQWKRPYDPRQLDSRVTFAGRELGFYYLYHPKQILVHQEKDPMGFSVIKIGSRAYRQPLTHCQVALGHFHEYLETKNEAAKQQFLRSADLLLEAMETVTLGGIACRVWYYRFPLPTYVPHPIPWISCMAQGGAMSVFCRAYQMTGRKEFLDAAKGATAVYNVPVEQGGILGADREEHVYYEEYPFPGKSYHVLNGFMSSLMGLYDLYRATGDEEAKRLFDQGMATLTADSILARYDLGYCSLYDLSGVRRVRPAYIRYNLVHVRQLTVFYRITGNDLLRRWAERWFAYSQNPLCRFRCLLDTIVYGLRNIPRHLKEAMIES